MTIESNSFPVPPDSVYVWRGFKNPKKDYSEFAGFLGSVFVPACALLQPPVGLRAYFPTLVPQSNKNDVLPDQTALMFWATPQSHNLANETVAVRVYQNLHGELYDMARSKTQEVPVALPAGMDHFSIDQPYYLFPDSIDWMLGDVVHVVGARNESQLPSDFTTSIFQWASNFQKNTPTVVDGTLISCGRDYAVAWAHATIPDQAFPNCLDDFASMLQVQLHTTPRHFTLKEELWSNWLGIDYQNPRNAALHFLFDRPAHTDPIE